MSGFRYSRWTPARGRNLHAKLKLRTRAAVEEYRDSFIERLQREIDASQCDTILLSNEHLSSRANRPENVVRIVQALRGIAEDIRVLIYLRPQYELVLSGYSTAVKSGRLAPIDTGKTETNHNYNYDRMLSYWEGGVGIENIIVRRFLKQYFEGGSLITDFFAALGIPMPADLVIPPNRNSRLDAETVEFLRYANRSVPPRIEGLHNPDRNGLVRALENISTGPLIAAPPEELAAIDEAFADINQRVNERYFPGSKEPLFPPFAGEEGAFFSLGTERAVEIGIALWREARKAALAKSGDGTTADEIPWRRRGRARVRPAQAPAADDVDAEGDEYDGEDEED
ncbi:MAG: hypothetical protein WDN04_20585 [Rhodospirillales bacterium]